ncbi:MAG: hypothetical protein A3C90_04600 [Candidatus Magasanikbacteria bacterium RIFCSPHIGHO2_02_FULL_51_14]|uniref:Uncharacterized protein n=1 Tax=Candidatus Magasanikbacteria bacterium RIFCSPHIGHO2_02_FULL_51_14 TaxID=1798683 RepID=A0A1F6MQE5_9BACT|nr:MAG: hypothetical protein A3C90_04600 [Candidatus Magasanikbacteria bacterium RIFCSPHIGHO2_02_FULL_51_14]
MWDTHLVFSPATAGEQRWRLIAGIDESRFLLPLDRSLVSPETKVPSASQCQSKDWRRDRGSLSKAESCPAKEEFQISELVPRNSRDCRFQIE